MKKLNELILEKRRELGLNQKNFGLLIGQGQTTISDWENGEISMPRNIEKLSQVLGVSEQELTAMMATAGIASHKTKRLPPAIRASLDKMSASAPIEVRSAPVVGLRDVPVYGRARGGDNGEYEFNGEIMGWEMRPPVLDGVRDAYSIYVDGESMYPRFKPGETVWINPSRALSREDDVVVQLYPDDEDGISSAYIKEFVSYTPQHLIVRQHNPPLEIKMDRVRIKSVHKIVFSQKG